MAASFSSFTDRGGMSAALKKKKQYDPVKQRFSLYFKAVDALRADNLIKCKRYLNQKNFSYNEKRVLLARLEVHKKNWKEGIEILQRFQSESHPFILGEVHNLLSFCYANLGDEFHSLEHLKLSFQEYKKIEYGKGCFTVLYNLGVHFEHLGDFEEANKYYKQAESYAYSQLEKMEIQRSRAFMHAYLDEKEVAKEIALLLVKESSQLNIKDRSTSLAGVYKIFFAIGDRESFYKVLQLTLKNKSGQYYTEALTDKLLAELIENGRAPKKVPMLVRTSDIGKRWLVCESLIKGYRDRAKAIWAELMEKSPERYDKNFTITSIPTRLSPFGKCLEKVLSLAPKGEDDSFILLNQLKSNLPKKKADRLIYILENFQGSCPKEALIEAIWECEYDPSIEPRFYKLVERVKKQVNFKIEKIGGSYRKAD